jgi:hypothetical protein
MVWTAPDTTWTTSTSCWPTRTTSRPRPRPPPELQVQYGILIRVGNKVQESALADLLEKNGWEKFLRLSEDA